MKRILFFFFSAALFYQQEAFSRAPINDSLEVFSNSNNHLHQRVNSFISYYILESQRNGMAPLVRLSQIFNIEAFAREALSQGSNYSNLQLITIFVRSAATSLINSEWYESDHPNYLATFSLVEGLDPICRRYMSQLSGE